MSRKSRLRKLIGKYNPKPAKVGFGDFCAFALAVSSPIRRSLWNKLIELFSELNKIPDCCGIVVNKRGGATGKNLKTKRQTSGNRGTQSRGSKFHANASFISAMGMLNMIAGLPNLKTSKRVSLEHRERSRFNKLTGRLSEWRPAATRRYDKWICPSQAPGRSFLFRRIQVESR